MRLFIEPTEPLLFRTGRPFDAGENNFAETLFPPTPETLQGAIRAAIAVHWDTTKTIAENFHQEELVQLIGDRTRYGRFRITGISLGRRSRKNNTDGNVERLYPMPAHVLQEEDGVKRQARLEPKSKEDGIYTNLPDDKQLLYPDKKLDDKLDKSKRWLTEHGLHKALLTKEDLAKEDIVKSNEIYTVEPRLGIGMNNTTKTTEEGLLYQVQMIRMNHLMEHPYVYGFIVDIRLAQSSDNVITYPENFTDDVQTQELLKLPNQGWVILGGERRAARFEIIKPSEDEQHNGLEQLQRGNLLYLATPAAFARGWQPRAWIDWAEPIAVAIDRYQPVGGWLLTPGSSGGDQKPIRRCVPAGSIYFFNETVNIIRPFTDYGMEIGYGITYAGEL